MKSCLSLMFAVLVVLVSGCSSAKQHALNDVMISGNCFYDFAYKSFELKIPEKQFEQLGENGDTIHSYCLKKLQENRLRISTEKSGDAVIIISATVHKHAAFYQVKLALQIQRFADVVYSVQTSYITSRPRYELYEKLDGLINYLANDLQGNLY